MPYKYVTGDILETTCEAVVNAVNCVGVAGRGLALAFRDRYPRQYGAYHMICKAGKLRPGSVMVQDTGDAPGPAWILNAATVEHWRDSSSLQIVDACAKTIAKEVRRLGIASVAVPALGCGGGNLDWTFVREVLRGRLRPLSKRGVRVEIYLPKESHEGV